MKKIQVAAAIIEKDGKILIARRAYGKQEGLWEFPGGKYEEGETGEETIIREIYEEFSVMIKVKAFLCTIEHQYEDFYLIMDCYICELCDDHMLLHDHSAMKWIDADDENIDWVPADRKVIDAYRLMIE